MSDPVTAAPGRYWMVTWTVVRTLLAGERFHLIGVDMAGNCHTLMTEAEMPAAENRSTLH